MIVEDVLDNVIPRLGEGRPQCSILEAVASVHGIIVNRLLLKRSDLVKETIPVDVAKDATSISVPDNYFAPDGLPTVTGQGKVFPLPADADLTLSVFSTPGVPRWQRVKGRSMAIYPPADQDYTMLLPAFVRPAAPALMDDELPFWGTFDGVYAEGAFAVLKEGLAVVADQAFVAIVTSQVDQVLTAKAMADEQAVADAINEGYGD